MEDPSRADEDAAAAHRAPVALGGGHLTQLHELTGPDGFVFPAFHTSRRPLSENTVNQAFRRMGYAVDEVTAHGLRTTASILLNESGKWSPDAIERSLAVEAMEVVHSGRC